MPRALTLDEISSIIEQHPAAFATVAAQPVIAPEAIASGVARMAIDPAVVRSVIAIATGTSAKDVPRSFGTYLDAIQTVRETLAAYPRQDIAKTFYRALAPGFGQEAGRIQ